MLSGFRVKKLISPIIGFRDAVTARENMAWEIFWNNKVIRQFSSYLEGATSKCPPKHVFLILNKSFKLRLNFYAHVEL